MRTNLGTPIEMTDQNQNIVWQASYDPFGAISINSSSTITNNLRFPGMYSDSETGLYYNMNRYYYPAIGRYIEPDAFNVGSESIYTMEQINNAIQQAVNSNNHPSIVDQTDIGPKSLPASRLLLMPSLQTSYPFVTNNSVNYSDPSGLYVGGVGVGGAGEWGSPAGGAVTVGGDCSYVWDDKGNKGIVCCSGGGITNGEGASVFFGGVVTNDWGSDTICDYASGGGGGFQYGGTVGSGIAGYASGNPMSGIQVGIGVGVGAAGRGGGVAVGACRLVWCKGTCCHKKCQ